MKPEGGPTHCSNSPAPRQLPALWLWPRGRDGQSSVLETRLDWLRGSWATYLTADIALIGWARRMKGLTPSTNSSGDHVATSSAIVCRLSSPGRG